MPKDNCFHLNFTVRGTDKVHHGYCSDCDKFILVAEFMAIAIREMRIKIHEIYRKPGSRQLDEISEMIKNQNGKTTTNAKR